MARRALAVLLLAAAPFAAGAHASAATLRSGLRDAATAVSAETYASRLERAASLARSALSAPSSQSMARVRQAVGLPVLVSIGRTATLVEDDAVLDRLTGAASADFEIAARHLDALAAAARAAIRTPTGDRERIRRAAAGAVRGLEVQPGPLDRLRAAVARFLYGIYDRLSHFQGATSVVAWAVVLVVVAGIVLLVRRAGLGLVAETRAASDAPQARPRRPDEWRLLAESAAAHGDVRGAVRALYSAIVATLRSRGLVPDQLSLTSGECRASVAAGAPALYPAVADASAVFERVVYGLLAPDARDLALMREADRSIEAA